MSNPATIIRDQLGGACLALLGAKDLFATKKGQALQFKIGKGPKGVNLIEIELDPSDTYTVTFSRIWGLKVTEKGKFSDVYADMLLDLIEDNTGLYTRFLMEFLTIRTDRNSLTSPAKIQEANGSPRSYDDVLDALVSGFEVIGAPSHTPERRIPRPADGLGDAYTIPEHFIWHLIRKSCAGVK